MDIAILTSPERRKELEKEEWLQSHHFIWADSVRSLLIIEADVYIDLLFEYEKERIEGLKKLLPKPVLVNPVNYTQWETLEPLIRINGFPPRIKAEIDRLADSLPSIKN